MSPDTSPETSRSDASVFSGAVGRALEAASRVLAIVGVLVICGLAMLLCVTIVGRKLFSWQVMGDHELVQIFAAVSVSMLFPWCHITGGNVIVDLLSTRFPAALNRWLDRIGSLLLGCVALLLAWRTGLLAEQSYARGSFTPLLAWPIWVPQMLMIPGLVLTGIVGLHLAFAPGALAERDAAAGAIQ